MSDADLNSPDPVVPAEKIAPLEDSALPEFRREVEAFAKLAQEAGLRFDAPPLVLPENPAPESLAEAMTFAFYKLVELKGPVLSLVWRVVTAFAMTSPALIPIREAGERIAADFDRGIGAGHGNGYHNAQHTAEVMLSSHVFALLERRLDHALFPEARLLLMLAALVHDWHHDGKLSESSPFHHENMALDAARPYLACLSAGQMARLELMVRATEAGTARQFVHAALQWHGNARSGVAPVVPEGMKPITAFLQPDHAVTCELASLLIDADGLPLFGLTPDYALLLTHRLRDEWETSIGHKDFVALLDKALAGRSFLSLAGGFFTPNIEAVVEGHAALLGEIAEDDILPAPSAEPGIDLSFLQETKAEAENIGKQADISLETVADLQATMKASGYFDNPPFTLTPRNADKLVPGLSREASQRVNLADESADSLVRLHTVSGPLLSAVVSQLLESIGLRVDDPVGRGITGIAREIDNGVGSGRLDDLPDGDRNLYHNSNHILDLVLLSDLIGQRATQRKATASSPLARGLVLLAALVCHWHHTGKGNRVDGTYRMFHLQDRAMSFAQPHIADMSKELRQSLDILVRCTDPREPYAFSRAVYSNHVGLGPRPEIPPGCEPLARLLGDPALCTLSARLNDVLYIPFVGLGSAYSARSMVQLGREIGQPIDFNFVRKNLIAPMLSRPPYPGETPLPELMVGRNRVASFTSAEAQAIFNPALQDLLVSEAKKSI